MAALGRQPHPTETYPAVGGQAETRPEAQGPKGSGARGREFASLQLEVPFKFKLEGGNAIEWVVMRCGVVE